MSVTGRCRRYQSPGRRASGFTLIEILVALVIVGVLGTTVVLVLPDAALEQRRASVRAWQAQGEMAALRAEVQAQPFAWEIGSDSARLLFFDHAKWQLAVQANAVLPLAEGLLVDYLEVDGQRLPLGSRIVFAGTPPLFVVHISDGGRTWQLSGQPNGTITQAETP